MPCLGNRLPGWSCGAGLGPSPALLTLAADAGAFAALGGQDVGVAGVGVAPAQVLLQPAGQDSVIGVAGVAHDEAAQGTELSLGIGLAHEALVGVKHSSTLAWSARAADGRGLVRGQVVHDHEERVAAGAGGPDGLQRGQGVITALAAADDAPQLIIAEGVAAVEVADAVRAVIGRGQPAGFLPRRPRGAVIGPDGQRAELVKGKAPVRELCWSPPRSGPASPPCPGQQIPSRSGSAGS